jgi:hypothetical protein
MAKSDLAPERVVCCASTENLTATRVQQLAVDEVSDGPPS